MILQHGVSMAFNTDTCKSAARRLALVHGPLWSSPAPSILQSLNESGESASRFSVSAHEWFFRSCTAASGAGQRDVRSHGQSYADAMVQFA